MGNSHLNDSCLLFLEPLHESFSVIFFCTAASGPYLVTNRKALILHEQNMDHGKIFKWSSRTVLTELDDHRRSWYGFYQEHGFKMFTDQSFTEK